MSYTYLISGLEDLRAGQQPKMSLADFMNLLQEQLTDNDMKLIELLQMKNDDPVIMEIWEQEATQDRFAESIVSEADFRTQLLYEYGMRSCNRFVRKWFAFNLDLNNVMAASICQKHSYDISRAIVGENEVAQLLRKGGLNKNSSLAAVLPELGDIVALTNIDNLLDRERAIDNLRWQWLEDTTLFCYFEIDNVLAYFLKMKILDRWSGLSVEHGEEVFRGILADMKRDVKFA